MLNEEFITGRLKVAEVKNLKNQKKLNGKIKKLKIDVFRVIFIYIKLISYIRFEFSPYYQSSRTFCNTYFITFTQIH